MKPNSYLELARRLEASQAEGNARTIVAYGRLFPEVGAGLMPVAGGYALYAGVDSPVTQAVGLGMSGQVSEAELEAMEEFFRERGARASVMVCRLSDPSLRSQLAERGYVVEETENMLCGRLDSLAVEAGTGSEAQVRMAEPDEAELWARTVAAGFSEGDESQEGLMPLFLAAFSLPTTSCFLAMVEGEAAGGGAVGMEGGVAALFAGSTRPEFRRRGVQSALVRVRLAHATAGGAELAAVMTQTGSGSQRNMERAGFEVVYQEEKMVKRL